VQKSGERYKMPLGEHATFSHLQKQDPDKVEPAEQAGLDLWDRLFERDRKYGGYTSFFVGAPGTGKTSAMLSILDTTISQFPHELNLWAEPACIPIQFLHSNAPHQILVSKDYPLHLFRIEDDKPLTLCTDIKIRRFRTPSEAVSMCKTACINAVYFPPDKLYRWTRIINKFRYDSAWENVYFDEAESVFPLRASDIQWHKNEDFSDSFKETQKARCNIYMNSQQRSDVDWRISGKLNMVCYFRGSKVDKHAPLWQTAVHRLDRGQCYIVFDNADFGSVRFERYEPADIEYVLKPKQDVRA